MRASIASRAATVGHVGDFHFDVNAALRPSVCHGRLSFGIRLPPTVEHDGLGPAVGTSQLATARPIPPKPPVTK